MSVFKVFLNSFVPKDVLLNIFRVFSSDARVYHIMHRERKINLPFSFFTRDFNSKHCRKLLFCRKSATCPINLEVENMKFL